MAFKISNSSNYNIRIIVSILLSILVFQAVSSLRIKSPTFDEPTNLLSGYLALKNDYSFGADHPPFLKSLAAFPLLFLEITPPEGLHSSFTRSQLIEIGSKFLFHPQHDVDQIVFLSRLPVVFLSCLLGIFVFLWAKTLYGNASGLFALTLYVFSPNILAHSRLIDTDFGATCFIFIACFYYWSYLSSPSFKRLCLTSLFLGVALVSKFSAALLFPIFFVILVVKLLTEKEFKLKNLLIPPSVESPQTNVKTFFIHFCVPLIIVTVVIFFAFGLNLNSLDLYKKGLDQVNNIYFKQTPQLNYMMGYFFYEPSIFFPIVAFLVKTPIPTLAFTLLSLLILRKNHDNLFNELSLIVPILAIFSSHFFDPEHTGVRRFLPIYPFIFVFVGRLASDTNILNLVPLKRKFAFAAITTLTLWYIISSIRIHPDYLTYFNEAAGGPKNGINYLDNSNVDWGQDLKRLKPYIDKEGINRIKLMYQGTALPSYYKIPAEPVSAEERENGPKPGYYAISANYLIRLSSIPKAFGFGSAWKEKLKNPIKVIGHTIYIFYFSPP